MEIGNKLEVIYKGNIKAGELWVDNEGYYFKYDDDFIENDNTRPISVNMPKDQKTYHSKELFHYFKSILSEGENRKQICKALRIDPSDDWSLLALSCQYDTIGAITVKNIKDGSM
ncbi:MAG: HipA N-terminal domain-containing protein [Bacteroidetes bacterium]|nr:HipA N-terminal domain-containing protein [Bacteroidota bacterium]